MDDFLFYFLAGMFGEELVRRLATKKVYFPLLWLACTIIVGIIFTTLTLMLFVTGIFSDHPPPAQGFIGHAKDFMHFHFVMIQPWAFLFYSGMGFMLALSYRAHYHNRQRHQNDSGKDKGQAGDPR